MKDRRRQQQIADQAARLIEELLDLEPGRIRAELLASGHGVNFVATPPLSEAQKKLVIAAWRAARGIS